MKYFWGLHEFYRDGFGAGIGFGNVGYEDLCVMLVGVVYSGLIYGSAIVDTEVDNI